MDNYAVEIDNNEIHPPIIPAEEMEMNKNKREVCKEQENEVATTSNKENTFSTFTNVSSEVENKKLDKDDHNGVLYGILDVPPWYISIPLGLQHNLEMITAATVIPFLLSIAICMENDDPNKAVLTSTLIFMSGIITILQSTLGNTLPIVQGGSFSYLVPSLAIMNLPKWKCPANLSELSNDEKMEEWQVRMRELQGAIICASMVEVLLAVTGCIGYLTKYVTPITVAPAITLIGLTLFQKVMVQCSKNYWVAFSMTIILIILSQHMRNVTIPLPKNKSSMDGNGKKHNNRFPIFQVLPILLALVVVWLVCGFLTLINALPEGDPARVDAKKRILEEFPWFRIPYPFQFGLPTVSIGAVLGILCGVLTSTVESIGDYYCCASIIQAPVPPEHAMNRGIFVEGLGCVLSGIVGTGNASTSYSHNIGTLGLTKVGSRRVIQVAGCTMLLFGVVGKAGAIFVSLPDPILGGMFLFLFPLVMAVGIGTLKDVDLESSRNIFIISFSIFLGLALSQWMNTNPGLINTSSQEFNSLATILLSTGMFVAGFTAFILDNTVSGTDEERGLSKRKAAATDFKAHHDTTYDLPIGMDLIRRFHRITKWIPISPTFENHPITLLQRKKGEAKFSSENIVVQP